MSIYVSTKFLHQNSTNRGGIESAMQKWTWRGGGTVSCWQLVGPFWTNTALAVQQSHTSLGFRTLTSDIYFNFKTTLSENDNTAGIKQRMPMIFFFAAPCDFWMVTTMLLIFSSPPSLQHILWHMSQDQYLHFYMSLPPTVKQYDWLMTVCPTRLVGTSL